MEINIYDLAKEKNILTDKRHDGNTTRLIDLSIQELFKDNHVFIEYDKCFESRNNKYFLYDKIKSRLHIEHKHVTASYHFTGKGIVIKLVK
jgi:hypothetical protein